MTTTTMPPHEVAQRLEAAIDEVRGHHAKHVSVNYPEPGICVSRCFWPHGKWPCHGAMLARLAGSVLRRHPYAMVPAFDRADCGTCGTAWPCGEVRSVAQALGVPLEAPQGGGPR
jgi:hypothetical protein